MKLIAHSQINHKGVFLNGELLLSYDKNVLKHDYKMLYRTFDLSYPKFFKMDNLSKMAILSASIIMDKTDNIKIDSDKIQMIFANHSSSQTTDLKFIDSYQIKKSPGPALFVYTLPNILMGELSIKFKWYGENCFFILNKFDADFFEQQIQYAFNRGNAHCLCGWIESNQQGEECIMFIVSNDKNTKSEKGWLKEQLKIN